jgi:hypothetical protein
MGREGGDQHQNGGKFFDHLGAVVDLPGCLCISK